ERASVRLASREPLALAYVDLDRFKLINDLFGHISGDEVLRQVAQRIGEGCGARESVGRIGGDEFVVVFQGVPVQRAAERCRTIVERIGGVPFQMGDKAFQVKCSIGLIEVASGTLVKDAIAMADRACRDAKTGQRDALVVYHSDAPVFRERARELRLIGHLGAGVAPEGLFLAMQPIMSLRAPFASLNFEVLIRMREPDGTILGGGQVIAAAENNGRVAVIDRWVLASTLAWLDAHRPRLANTRFACLNLSGASLNDEKFIRDAFAMLAEHRSVADLLCVEITESVALHDLANTKRFIERLRDFGARVALDDFGAGYTSFSYLKELPADAVKIDGSFVRGVNVHPANLAIVEAIVELARNLGMQSIAEWTEDRATVEALAQVGVDYVQGYAIARPQEPHRILQMTSAASFIEDAQLASFVGKALVAGQGVRWPDPADETHLGLH
ncbi:MAG: bifunctional diguanylate cyclase/phosphodiesterase, partial [Betaproteobacteria bacterium]|nr:bifunctional diguanylate cyclase/phosphodiesterase [Betaproteobacteria bacterium]